MALVLAVGLAPLPAFANTANEQRGQAPRTSLDATSTREAKANAPATDEGVALTIASLTDASLAAQSESGTVVSGLDGTVVRIRPQGSYSALSIKSDGSGYHSVVHMYHIGGSSRFKLEKVSSDSDGDYAIAILECCDAHS